MTFYFLFCSSIIHIIYLMQKQNLGGSTRVYFDSLLGVVISVPAACLVVELSWYLCLLRHKLKCIFVHVVSKGTSSHLKVF